MEDIEKNIDNTWTDMQKALYVYDFLTSKIHYNQDYETDLSGNDQNLKPLITGSGVCAGYSSIFYEMMKRQNISCDYVRGKRKESYHAWNILNIDGKTFPVDLTGDACAKSIFKSDSLLYFGNVDNFNKHIMDSDELEYTFETIDRNDIKENLDVVNGRSANVLKFIREDDSEFVFSNLGLEIIDDNEVYKYAQSEVKNGRTLKTNILYSKSNFYELSDSEKYFFCNNLLDKARIEKYISKANGYVGEIKKEDNVLYKTVHEDLVDKFKNRKMDYTRENDSNIVISKTDKGSNNLGINNYMSTEFINTRNGIKLKNNIIYTKEDLLLCNDAKEKEFVANELLSREHIDTSIQNNGGYIGNTTRIFGRYKISVNKNMEKQFMKYEETKKMAA